MKMGTLLMLAALAAGASGARPAAAHEPLFMMSHEAPGKGASDFHLTVHGERVEVEDETELELEYTRGLTRDLAVKVGLPLARHEEWEAGRLRSAQGLADPSVRVKWRLWDRDLLGAKYAVAAMVESTVPVGDGSGRVGSRRPAVTAGLAHGREGLAWYYFADARYLYRAADGGGKPGDGVFVDGALGWRPYLGTLEQTDVVLFLELNYRHAFRAEAGGEEVPRTAGDYVLVAPEILLSPHNRMMVKAGLQVPLVQAVDEAARRVGVQFVLETELRF